jgi:Spy/CpxP family protein refolding chaperone
LVKKITYYFNKKLLIMKKLLFLTLIFSGIISTTTHAQTAANQATVIQPAKTGADPAAMLQQVKETVRPQMVEKTGLTEAQADKVIEINFAFRQRAATALHDLNEADRAAKIAEFRAAKEKMLSEILTAEQIKSVNTFYEDMGKNMPQKAGN